MDFQERLEKAVQRGQRRNQARSDAAKAKALSVEELKRLHNEHRLTISDHIEKSLRALPQHFPGFELETVYGDAGWGTAAKRDDAGSSRGDSRRNFYSRLELTVRPISSAYVLELNAKATIRNKEIFNRKHFEKLTEVSLDTFRELVDAWILEYAEMFAASA